MKISTYTAIAALVATALAQLKPCFYNGGDGFCDGDQVCKAGGKTLDPACTAETEGKPCTSRIGKGTCISGGCNAQVRVFDPDCAGS
ncbi:hypothetical protein LZ30DRAFT_724724 [Colletotrichum cereale]|nr:hypothetical protein LZ30DRAFT_724724 [Colletotrichum cereale]